MQNLKRYKGIYVPNRNRVTDFNKSPLIKGGREGEGFGVDRYTLLHVK